MKRWLVCTPEHGEVIPVLDDGTGPMEWGCDCVEIEADTKRDAIMLGVRLMLNSREFKYCRDRRSDNLSPYTGVKAEEMQPCGVCNSFDCDEPH